MIRSIFFILLLAISSVPISLMQTQFVNASSKSPYDSGYDHGCDDADISDQYDRYINQPDKGPSHHTSEFMDGYRAGLDDCSAGGSNNRVSDSGGRNSGGNDNNDDDNGNEKTYCDVPNPSNPCHDRKDYSDDTGLYTCIDGSHEEDWRDCEGGGAGDENDNDNGNGNGDSDDLPQEGGCQPEDDYCDLDEDCHLRSVDCIDDRGFDEDDYDD